MRTFVQHEIHPVAGLLRYEGITHAHVLELTQSVAEFGLPGIVVAPAQGGLGVDWVTQGLLFEELAKGSNALAGQVLINTLAAALLAQQPDVSARYLDRLLEGRLLVGIAPQVAGANCGLRAQRQADGWLLDGECDRLFSHQEADLLLCAVQQEDSLWAWMLLDRDEDQFELRHRHSQVGPGRICLQVTQARLPASRLLVAVGSTPLADYLTGAFKLHQAVAQVARGQVMLDGAIQRAREATQFGQPVAAQQMVALQFAELATQLEATRLLCKLGFEHMQAGQLAGNLASRARLLATDTTARIERRVNRMDCSAGTEPEHGTAIARESGLLSVFSERLAVDAQRIAGELLGGLPAA
ncbi:Glutaryl-CoA dehydrogenase [compost metagenome]